MIDSMDKVSHLEIEKRRIGRDRDATLKKNG